MQRSLVFLVSFSILALPILGAPPKQHHSTPKTSFLTGNFDPSLTKLPASFVGHSPKTLLAEAKLEPKGEYETTEAYNTRTATRPARLYAVRMLNPLDTKYDADERLLTITLPTSLISVGFDRKSDYLAYPILTSIDESSTYVGTNAFGAIIEIEKTRTREFDIIARTDSSPQAAASMQLSLSADDAKRLRSRLAVLLICANDAPREEQPLLWDETSGATGFDSHSPTVDEPEDTITYYYSVRLNLRELWIFDPPTGKIYGKFDSFGTPLDNTRTPTP